MGEGGKPIGKFIFLFVSDSGFRISTRRLKTRLEESLDAAMVNGMNAAQIIEEIQRLPEDERDKVLDFARHHPNAETLEAMRDPVEEGRSFKSAAELFASIEAEDEC